MLLSYIFQLDSYSFTLSFPVNRVLSGDASFLMLLATNVAIIIPTNGVTEIIKLLFLNFNLLSHSRGDSLTQPILITAFFTISTRKSLGAS